MSNENVESRRTFLKSSTAAAAGTVLAAGLDLGIARSAHAAGSDVIKVALIGCGGRGTGAASQLMTADPNLKLIAVADAFEDKAKATVQRLTKDHGKQVDVAPDQIFAGLDAYQKVIASDADLIAIATPPGFRPTHYSAAIAANKNVFMEKPCCVDAPGYKIVMDTNKVADQKGLFVAVGLQRHHEPRYMETVKRIQDGQIGDVKFLRVYWNGGGIWNRPREPWMTELQYQVNNWYHFCWASGDNICEQHIHNLDVANWVLDAHPVEANGMGGCSLRYLGDMKGTGQIFDHHFVEFTYADGTKVYSQCRHMRNTWSQVSEWAHGTNGFADCSGRIEGENAWRFRGTSPGGHQQEQRDLVAALRAGKRYNEGYYGANSSMTSVFGRMATYSGKVVKWDEALAQGTSSFPKTLSWDAPAPVQKDADGNYPIPVPGVHPPYEA